MAYKFVKRPARGFTLLEVMVALMIVAFALTALSASMNQMIDAANAMRDRTYANWIAQNKIAELRLANEIPEVGTTSGDIEFSNTTWEWNAVVSETGIENFMRIDVSVSHFGDDYVVQTVTGFIGEPVPVNWGSRIYQRGGTTR